MWTTPSFLKFEGLDACIALLVDKNFIDALPFVFPNWQYNIYQSTDLKSFASVIYVDEKYIIDSPFMEKQKRYRDPANALCSLIVELAWERLREDAKLLCLHGAAIEFAGKLVIFPSTRRAGKSTLTVALAATGKKVFTDDFLPLSVAKDGHLLGVSSGISPRLRLPVPEQIGERAKQYINSRGSVSNNQYKYVKPISEELAKFGETAPVGSLVFLERSEDIEPVIELVSKSEALASLIRQNFSRAMNAAGILKLLAFITDTSPAYRLKYDDVEDAIKLLERQFQSWSMEEPLIGKDLNASLFESVPDVEYEIGKIDVTEGQLMHAKGVTEIERDGKRFLTGRDGRSIHFLNEGAAIIWRLLVEPTSNDEAIEMLSALYPDHPVDAIRKDVVSTLNDFARNGMIQRTTI
ncbi:hypothetical protein A9Q96_14480 [Rhodobacterales bacterium 52_120_T64]|nr:hypothetical protein A9Q96_14480 [Rhodobacterales bacterium 52_120_T64]